MSDDRGETGAPGPGEGQGLRRVPPSPRGDDAVEQTWHIEDSQGQILALASE